MSKRMLMQEALHSGAPALARRRRAWLILALAAALLVALAIVALGVGAYTISPARAFGVLAAELGVETLDYRSADPSVLGRQRAVLLA
ncbi:MAG: hypothetical protein ACLFNT_13520, partial [Spirochaetales bacterium]